jgi:nucleoside-diphosphate-sugar epimerase
VGAGFIADYHLQILRNISGIDVVGVCDPDVGRLNQVADRWSIDVRTRDVADLIAKAAPDVVHVLVPPALHHRVARQVLDAGVNVFVEKPLGVSEREAKNLASLAQEKGLCLGVNHNWLHQPLFRRALADIAARRIGPVQHVVSVNSLPLFQLVAGMHDHWMFADPTNVLFEQAPHPLSQICALLGDVVEIDSRQTGPKTLRGGKLFYPSWQFSIRGARASAQLSLSFEQSFPDARLHIVGQDGTIHIDQLTDLYTLDRRTRFVEPVDRFVRGIRQAHGITVGACGQLAGYGLSLFGIGGRRDTYFLGMKASIEEFYRELLGKQEASGLKNGLQTIAALQRVVDGLNLIQDKRPAPLAAEHNGSAPRRPCSEGKVLIIGAGGFIGRKLITRLAECGYDLRLMVRSPARLADLKDLYGFQLVQGDVREALDVDQAVAGCETVIHLAAGAPDSWSEYQRLFVEGLTHVANAVQRHAVQRLFFASSIASLYLGDPRIVITEDLAPDVHYEKRCYYAKAKILCEQLLRERHAVHGLPSTIFRPGIVIGEGSQPQHLGVGEWPSEVVCARWGRDVSQPLPFVLVDDVVEAFLCAMKLRVEDVAGKQFNLVGDIQLSAQDYINLLRQETQRDFRLYRQSLTTWSLIESAKWAVKFLARKPENSRLTWHELAYRTAASRFNCEQTKRTLKWQPTTDREVFIERGIRAALRGT